MKMVSIKFHLIHQYAMAKQKGRQLLLRRLRTVDISMNNIAKCKKEEDYLMLNAAHLTVGCRVARAPSRTRHAAWWRGRRVGQLVLCGGKGAVEEGVTRRRPGRLSCWRAARAPLRKVPLGAVQQDAVEEGVVGRRPTRRHPARRRCCRAAWAPSRTETSCCLAANALSNKVHWAGPARRTTVLPGWGRCCCSASCSMKAASVWVNPGERRAW